MKDRGSMADNFENGWKDAFDKMSFDPEERVWESIDRTLANNEVLIYRRKALIYKWAAIAAIIFAVSISIPGYFDFGDSRIRKGDTFLTSLTTREYKLSDQSTRISFGLTKSEMESEGLLDSKHLIVENSESEEPRQTIAMMKLATNLPTKRNGAIISLSGEKPSNQHIYLMPDYTAARRSNKRQNQSNDERFWAGVGVGSSTFDPNYQLTQPSDVLTPVINAGTTSALANATSGLLTDANASYEDNETMGSNYQVGFNMGMVLGSRLTLESGFAYAQSNLNSQTDRITENRFFATAVSAKEPLIEQTSARRDIVEYEREELALANTFQFAAVPVKAGYLVLDKKVNVRLNAGVVANFYMGNTITGQDQDYGSLELYPGISSPYRTVSFSGITGVTVGYNFLNNFDLIVEPNYSQALQPMTKVESDFNASPAGFGLMAGLRYRFHR